MTTVYFATNRAEDPAAVGGYGAQIVANDPAAIVYAVAQVDGIDLTVENSGTIASISDKSPGTFSDAATNAIIGAGKNLCIFIHGFANAFEDAIRRAAFNREWLAAAGIPAADFTMIAFTWPSAGHLFAAPPHMPPDAYLADQVMAGRSGYHLTFFFNVIDQLRADYKQRNPGARVFLLAHSMGNYVLQAGVQSWFDQGGSPDLFFDEAFLPAADERAGSFETPSGGRLSNLPKLAKRISIYYSEKDVAMYLSTTINFDRRMGFDGPSDKHDAQQYPPAIFRMLDCTEVDDFNPISPPDATHQYYRRSRIVRADIAATMANAPNPPGGLIDLPLRTA